jgi:hypothetical protein
MAIGVTRNTSVIAVKEETTEGVFVAPAAATDYVQPLADGFEIAPAKELIDRTVLTASVGRVSPRTGTKSVTAALPVEFRASGTEGAATDFDLLLKGALGNVRTITTQTTTKAAGNTATVLQIEDADISKFSVGDLVCVLESGDHTPSFVTAVDTTLTTANITVSPGRETGVFSNSVVVSKSRTYYPANDGHPSLSLSYYWGNTKRTSGAGCKVTTMSLDNFSVGQIASLNFGLEGLSFDEIDGAAPHTPSYDSGLPPLILNACVYQNGTNIQVNQFAVSLTNTLGFLTSTCSENGRISSRVTERTLEGSLNPYMDDTSVAQFTRFNQNTAFSLIAFAYNPSSTAGEIELGSLVGIYLPNCLITEKAYGDQDGILTDELSFAATRGTAGSVEEIYFGVV